MPYNLLVEFDLGILRCIYFWWSGAADFSSMKGMPYLYYRIYTMEYIGIKGDQSVILSICTNDPKH